MYSDNDSRRGMPDLLRDFFEANTRAAVVNTRSLNPGPAYGTIDRARADQRLARLLKEETIAWADPEDRDVVAPFLDSVFVDTPQLFLCAAQVDSLIQQERKKYLDRAQQGELQSLREMDEYQQSILSYRPDVGNNWVTKFAEDMFDWEILEMIAQKREVAIRRNREANFLEDLYELVKQQCQDGESITVGEAIRRAAAL